MILPAVSSIQRTLRQALAGVLGIGLANPAALSQEQILQLAIEVSRATPSQQAWLTRLFRGCGIQNRGVVLIDKINDLDPLESVRAFYSASTGSTDGGPTTAQRMARYAAEAPALAACAAGRAVSESQTLSTEITHLLTASCTGFMAPGIDAALIEQLGLSREIRRLHIGFMGCHAAFNLLAAARDVIRSEPGARVLVCCVELCTLHLAYGWEPGKLVANALFADGAAAAVIAQPEQGEIDTWHLDDTASLLMPNSPDAMTWTIGNHGFEMTLSPGIPTLIREHLRPWIENWLARHDLKITDIAGWAIHPGGPKILDAVADALNLPGEALAPSREILAGHGNMSSATILFILKKLFAQFPSGPCVAIGLGPGLIAEAMLFNAHPDRSEKRPEEKGLAQRNRRERD